MIRSQMKIIDDLGNCYNALAQSIIKQASFYYNSGIPIDKETILDITSKKLADSFECLLKNDAVISVEELNLRLLRMDNANVEIGDDENEIRNKLYRALKDKCDTDKKTRHIRTITAKPNSDGFITR